MFRTAWVAKGTSKENPVESVPTAPPKLTVTKCMISAAAAVRQLTLDDDSHADVMHGAAKVATVGVDA
jgi:hypothetical protein